MELFREFGFRCELFGAPAPPPEMRVAFVPVADRQVQILAREFGKKLAEPLPPPPPELEAKLGPHDVMESPPLFPSVSIRGYPPLHARLSRFGQTAAVAHWIHRMTIEVDSGRRGGVLQAVSLYLTGLDRDADNCAISSCRHVRLSVRGKSLPLPVTPAGWQAILDGSRPLAVQIFVQSLARIDPSVRCAFHGMGIAFFALLGVQTETEDPDE
jgi:hypothetical protein